MYISYHSCDIMPCFANNHVSATSIKYTLCAIRSHLYTKLSSTDMHGHVGALYQLRNRFWATCRDAMTCHAYANELISIMAKNESQLVPKVLHTNCTNNLPTRHLTDSS